MTMPLTRYKKYELFPAGIEIICLCSSVSCCFIDFLQKHCEKKSRRSQSVTLCRRSSFENIAIGSLADRTEKIQRAESHRAHCENTASGIPAVCAICGGGLEVLRRKAAAAGAGAPDHKSGAERKLRENSSRVLPNLTVPRRRPLFVLEPLPSGTMSAGGGASSRVSSATMCVDVTYTKHFHCTKASSPTARQNVVEP